MPELPKIVVGVDPSFDRLGLAIWSQEGPIPYVYLDSHATRLVGTRFEAIYIASLSQASWVRNQIEHARRDLFSGVLDSEILVVIEEPPPLREFSAGLFALVAVLSRVLDLWERAYVLPSKIPSLHGKRKIKKSESVVLWFDLVRLNPAVVQVQEKVVHPGAEKLPRVNHDQAQAGLLAFLGARSRGIPLQLPPTTVPDKWVL